MVTPVELTPTFRSAPISRLMDGLYNLRVESGVSYDVNPKTGGFMMIRLAGVNGAPAQPSLRVVLNWLQPSAR